MAPLTDWLILDVASAPMPEASSFLEEPDAPANYKDPAKIADYITAAKRTALDKAALDVDLAVITAVGCYGPDMDAPAVWLAKDEKQERERLRFVLGASDAETNTFITFNGFRFDLPLILRRCLYLGIEAPAFNLDKYRSPHVDLWQRLSHNGQVSAHSLTWYAKRFGWADVSKPLTGAEEAQVPVSGRWDDLKASVLHDVTVTHRLATRMGVIA